MLGLVVVTTTLAALAAWRSARMAAATEAAEPSGRSRPSAVARLLASAGLSPTATTGARMAFEPGRGRTAVPVRSGLTTLSLGLAGLVAAVVFAARLGSVVDTPSRYGWSWDLVLPGPHPAELAEGPAAPLAADSDVADLAAVRINGVEIGGEEVLAHGFQPLKGLVTPALTEGRPPAGPDEVALGEETLARLGLDLGDTVMARGTEGPVQLRIVGRGPIPFFDIDTVANGATMTREAIDRLACVNCGEEGDAFVYSQLVFNWAPGTDEGAARQRVEQFVGPLVDDNPPADVVNLDRVRGMPRVLAAFLALLAVLAVGHALVATAQRRRRDLAVLKAIGFRRRQVSATVAWQATLLALVGLAVGLPLGVVVGRRAWSLVANGVGVVDRPVVPLIGLALVVPATLLLANLIAALPGRAAARTQPATTLRTE